MGTQHFAPLVTVTLASLVLSFWCQIAAGCVTDALRLSDGRNEQEGRLEVCQDGVWGTICNDVWSTESTTVACRQLGIGNRGHFQNTIPVGTLPILRSNVNCAGEEESLAECPSNSGRCDRNWDVRITCIPPEEPPECEEGALRLVDGNSPYDGGLEICQVGVWGTICDYLWDRTDSLVACRQLFGDNVTAAYTGRYQDLDGSGPIHVSGVACTGSEASVAQCPSISASWCEHDRDVWLFCSFLTEPECSDGDVRLVGGDNEYEGRLEVCQEGLWGFVCDNGWYYGYSGTVACRQVGINAIGALHAKFGYGEGPAHLSYVQCVGTEESIFDCYTRTQSSTGAESLYCYQSEPVGVKCLVENETVAECVEGSVRLVDTSGLPTSDGNGLVEVCRNDYWSSVCHDNWDRQEAAMVCRQLGYDSTDVIGYLADGEYTGQVISADCSLQDSSFYDCTNMYGYYLCEDIKHGAVLCNSSSSECDDGDLRLTGSELANEGRLEVCYLGVWGTVCDEDWTISNAVVACRQLGFDTEGARFVFQYSPFLTSITMLENLECFGSEETLVDCIHDPFNMQNCKKFHDVGLYCQPTNQLTNVSESTVLTAPMEPSTASIIPGQPESMSTISVLGSTPGPTSTSAPAASSDLIFALAGFGAVVLLLVVTISVFVAIYVRKRRRRSHSKRTLSSTNANSLMLFEVDEELKFSGPPVLPRSYSIRVKESFVQRLPYNFVIPVTNLTLLMKIGEGEFGIVYKAKYSNFKRIDEMVAVKTLKGAYSQQEIDAMLEEALKMKDFQHQNVLNLIGVCVEADPAPYIVIPFMSNGSLLSYLRQEKLTLVLSDQEDEETVGDVTKRLTTMCQQISMGMKYLAGVKFVHRDLAARNCMLDENCVIKITDFGLSEEVYSKTYFRQESHSSMKLPVKWMALESLQEGVFSEKTDVVRYLGTQVNLGHPSPVCMVEKMGCNLKLGEGCLPPCPSYPNLDGKAHLVCKHLQWSYGVTCWEVFSGGKNPYPGMSPIRVVDMLDQGERMAQPSNAACTKKMYDLMMSCWLQDPSKRPTFASINTLLDKYLEEMTGYMHMQSILKLSQISGEIRIETKSENQYSVSY